MKDIVHETTDRLVEFYEKFSSWENSVVKGTDLSPTQAHALDIIGHNDNLQMKEIAQKMGITTGSVTVLIDKLDEKGLVERKPHEKDRRSYVIVLTKKGKDHFKQHHKHHLNLTSELISGLSESDKKKFLEIMMHVLKRF